MAEWTTSGGLDQHINFGGSGPKVRKEYLLDTPTECYDRTAPTDRIFYPGWLRESDYE